MNTLNSTIFALIGSAMGLLPAVFPSWFPPTGADQSSTRALWLDTMGIVQVGLGVGFLVRAHVFPAALRILSAIPTSDRGALALPDPHVVAGR
jgi:hypothetical protein